jgi:hypothetical protein
MQVCLLVEEIDPVTGEMTAEAQMKRSSLIQSFLGLVDIVTDDTISQWFKKCRGIYASSEKRDYILFEIVIVIEHWKRQRRLIDPSFITPSGEVNRPEPSSWKMLDSKLDIFTGDLKSFFNSEEKETSIRFTGLKLARSFESNLKLMIPKEYEKCIQVAITGHGRNTKVVIIKNSVSLSHHEQLEKIKPYREVDFILRYVLKS